MSSAPPVVSRLRRLPPLFFLGLFPVVILLWVWADSTRHRSAWTLLQPGGETQALILEQSALTFEQSDVDLSFLPPYRSALALSARGSNRSHRFERGEAGSPFLIAPAIFPAPAATQGDFDVKFPHELSIHVSRTLIPLWLILLAYFPLWLALSWWQARRRHAKIIAAALP